MRWKRSVLSRTALATTILFVATLASAIPVQAAGSCGPPSYSECAGADLRGADLRDKHFLYANFEDADLTGAHLNRSSFTGSNLIGVKANGAHLARASFNHSSLAGARLGSVLASEVRFVATDLSNAHAHHAHLSDAVFHNSNLTGVELNGAFLRDARLTHTRLGGANLSHAVATGAHLQSSNLVNADLTGANLDQANLHGVDANHAKFVHVHAHHAHMAEADFRRIDATGADLAGSNVEKANLNGSTLTGAVLRNLRATGAGFSDAQMQHSHPNSSNFARAKFNYANIADTFWIGSNVDDAYFHHAFFSKSSFAGAHGVATAHLFPSNVASDPAARNSFFKWVHAVVNAWGGHGFCQASSDREHADCKGTNEAGSATYPFGHKVDFGWGAKRSHGRRGFYIAGGDHKRLEGEASENLGAFHVAAAINMPEYLGTMDVHGAHAGDVGGPLAQRIDRVNHFFNGGYSLHFHGWLRRTVAGTGD